MINGRLPAELRWKDAFLFPVATRRGRIDIVIGGILILGLLPVGWVLNLGNRLNVVARLARNDQPYFTGFRPLGATFARGCVAAVAIASYIFPAATFFLGASAAYYKCSSPRLSTVLGSIGALFFILAIFTLPGCMTVYAVENTPRILTKPAVAFRRAWDNRRVYLTAWVIALSAMLLSFLGLLALGIGFLFTSVWAWEVVGYAFTVALYPHPKLAARIR